MDPRSPGMAANGRGTIGAVTGEIVLESALAMLAALGLRECAFSKRAGMEMVACGFLTVGLSRSVSLGAVLWLSEPCEMTLLNLDVGKSLPAGLLARKEADFSSSPMRDEVLVIGVIGLANLLMLPHTLKTLPAPSDDDGVGEKVSDAEPKETALSAVESDLRCVR